MRKLWKALAAFAVLVLLFVPAIRLFVPDSVGALIFIGVLTYEITLLFSVQIPSYRRWGLAYLALTGITYLLIGLLGLLPNSGLIVGSAWYHAISPGPLLTLLTGVMNPSSFDIDTLPYWISPYSEPGQMWLAVFASALGCIAMVAAFAMAKNKKIAYYTWFVLVALAGLGAAGYVVAETRKWGIPESRALDDPTATRLACSWAVSYAVAYVMARIGADPGKRRDSEVF